MSQAPKQTERVPVVAIVGHIDHGKSTLLDYIRRTNVVATEAGGITQHLSAYVAEHKNATGSHEITFLDTPGHEAFQMMRARGLEAADVAVLVVAADDGVKPQTIEALKCIAGVKIPYVIAFTKIDKPGADIDRAKVSLAEQGVFVEGFGGDVSWVGVSGKTGEGVPELLDLILLAAEMEGLSYNPDAPARGLVIEASLDRKRGATATLIIQDGVLSGGSFVVSGVSFSPVRIMENFAGKPIKEARAGEPVRLVGFSTLPVVGSTWQTFETKKLAEVATEEAAAIATHPEVAHHEEGVLMTLPVVIRSDVAGTGDAVQHEIAKLEIDPRLEIRILTQGVGAISENDIQLLGSGKTPGIALGFHVTVDQAARDLAERLGVTVATFDIIYKLTEWFAEEIEKRRPREKTEHATATVKVLKVFSHAKNNTVLGGRVETGSLAVGAQIKLYRRELELGRGEIVSLQSGRTPTKLVQEGMEFGAQVRTNIAIMDGDHFEAIEVILA